MPDDDPRPTRPCRPPSRTLAPGPAQVLGERLSRPFALLSCTIDGSVGIARARVEQRALLLSRGGPYIPLAIRESDLVRLVVRVLLDTSRAFPEPRTSAATIEVSGRTDLADGVVVVELRGGSIVSPIADEHAEGLGSWADQAQGIGARVAIEGTDLTRVLLRAPLAVPLDDEPRRFW